MNSRNHFYRDTEMHQASGKAGATAFVFLLAMVILVLLSAAGCKNAQYAIRGNDEVYTAYAGNDVYGDTIIRGKKYIVVYKNPPPQPAPQIQQPMGIPMGHTVLTGYPVTHETYAYPLHNCQLVSQLGRAADGQIVWRTACGADYPNEYYTPFSQINRGR